MEINREKFSKAEKKAEVANSLRAFISVNLVDIKTKIATLLGLIGRNEIFDEYTKHDISHHCCPVKADKQFFEIVEIQSFTWCFEMKRI